MNDIERRMGNVWFGKRTGKEKGEVKEEHRGDIGVRLKVRMKRGELEEMMKKVDVVSKNGNSSEAMGGLIFEECMKGRLRARLVVAGEGSSELSAFKYVIAKGWGLNPIQEHSTVNGDDDA